MALGACESLDQCAGLQRGIQRVHDGEEVTVASDRVAWTRGARGGIMYRILAPGDFPPISDAAVHECLGAEWAGSVEPQLRDGWFAPAIVYRRASWPNVVLLGDDDKQEVRIEPAG